MSNEYDDIIIKWREYANDRNNNLNRAEDVESLKKDIEKIIKIVAEGEMKNSPYSKTKQRDFSSFEQFEKNHIKSGDRWSNILSKFINQYKEIVNSSDIEEITIKQTSYFDGLFDLIFEEAHLYVQNNLIEDGIARESVLDYAKESLLYETNENAYERNRECYRREIHSFLGGSAYFKTGDSAWSRMYFDFCAVVKDDNGNIVSRSQYIDEFMDGILENMKNENASEAMKELFSTYGVLKLQYNEDGTKKNLNQLYADRANEIKIIDNSTNSKNFTEKNVLIQKKMCEEMYLELGVKYIASLSKEELETINNSKETSEYLNQISKYIANKMKVEIPKNVKNYCENREKIGIPNDILQSSSREMYELSEADYNKILISYYQKVNEKIGLVLGKNIDNKENEKKNKNTAMIEKKQKKSLFTRAKEKISSIFGKLKDRFKSSSPEVDEDEENIYFDDDEVESIVKEEQEKESKNAENKNHGKDEKKADNKEDKDAEKNESKGDNNSDKAVEEDKNKEKKNETSENKEKEDGESKNKSNVNEADIKEYKSIISSIEKASKELAKSKLSENRESLKEKEDEYTKLMSKLRDMKVKSYEGQLSSVQKSMELRKIDFICSGMVETQKRLEQYKDDEATTKFVTEQYESFLNELKKYCGNDMKVHNFNDKIEKNDLDFRVDKSSLNKSAKAEDFHSNPYKHPVKNTKKEKVVKDKDEDNER